MLLQGRRRERDGWKFHNEARKTPRDAGILKGVGPMVAMEIGGHLLSGMPDVMLCKGTEDQDGGAYCLGIGWALGNV